MNTLGPILTEISDYFNFFTHETEFQEEFKLKGGPQGSEWHTKFLNSEIRILKNKIKHLKAQFYEDPNLLDVVGDNAVRLSLFAGVERLITARQAQSLLVDRFGIKNGNGRMLTTLFDNGVRLGYFRGYLANFTNFLAVQYHSLFYARGNSFTQHFLFSSILEGVFHPIDTIRTVLYSDIRGRYKGYGDLANDLISRNGISHLYRGVSLKLGYNFFFIWNLRNMYDDKSVLFSFPAWMVSYALLNFKTKVQICDTRITNQSFENPFTLLLRSIKTENIKSIYAGFIPFILLNSFFMWNLKGLYGENRKKQQIANLEGKLKEIGAKRPLDYFENFL